MTEMSAERNSTLIFPLPTEILRLVHMLRQPQAPLDAGRPDMMEEDSEVVGMNPRRDEAHILAQLERHLAQDDPALAATMDALNDQFVETPEETDRTERPDGEEKHHHPAEHSTGREDEEETGEQEEGQKPRDWRVTAATVFAVIALVGLFISALLKYDPDNPGRENAPRGPGTSVTEQNERRAPPRTSRRQRLRGPGDIGTPTGR